MKKWSEQLIDYGLESCKRVGQTEWHHDELIVPRMSAESCFWNIFISHLYLMITRFQVQLRKILRIIKFIQHFSNNKELGTYLERYL